MGEWLEEKAREPRPGGIVCSVSLAAKMAENATKRSATCACFRAVLEGSELLVRPVQFRKRTRIGEWSVSLN